MLGTLRDAHEPLGLVVPPLPREQETEPPRDVGRGVLVAERGHRVEAVPEDPLGGRVVAGHHLDLADRDRVRGRRLPQAELLERLPTSSTSARASSNSPFMRAQEAEGAERGRLHVRRGGRLGDLLDACDRRVDRDGARAAA